MPVKGFSPPSSSIVLWVSSPLTTTVDDQNVFLSFSNWVSMSCKLCHPLSRLLHVGSLSCMVKVNDDDEDDRDAGICYLAST